jgi:carbon-monoxide dehydrogenase small subunit
MSSSVSVTVHLNGVPAELAGPNHMMLVDALRDRGLKGTKVSCDQGVCGSCTVLLDGTPAAACMTPLFVLEGKRIESVDGLSPDGRLHPVQQAFLECSAYQCGFCTSGMIMLVKGLLDAHPDPDHATIVRWLSSNICRCTGYAPIFRAVDRARVLLAERRPGGVHG